jgi:hypothetical protein
MKVFCVAILVMDKNESRKLNGKTYTSPEIGDECTVIESNSDGEILYYTLAEHDYQFEYDSRGFATLPAESAEEMGEYEKEAIVNLEN